VLTGEVTNTNCIVFGLTRSWLEPTIYHKRANRYTTDVVIIKKNNHSLIAVLFAYVYILGVIMAK
jgi:hypothetical protein